MDGKINISTSEDELKSMKQALLYMMKVCFPHMPCNNDKALKQFQTELLFNKLNVIKFDDDNDQNIELHYIEVDIMMDAIHGAKPHVEDPDSLMNVYTMIDLEQISLMGNSMDYALQPFIKRLQETFELV